MCWANPARYERPPGFRPLWDRHGTARYREFSGPRVPGCPPDVQDVRYAGSGRAVAPRPRWPEPHGVPRLDYLRYVVADVLEVARGGLGPDDPHAESYLEKIRSISSSLTNSPRSAAAIPASILAICQARSLT